MEIFDNFQLNLALDDEDLVPWLRAMPEEAIEQQVLATLKAGKFVLNLAQGVTSTEEDLARAFRPFIDKMDDVQTTMESILYATRTSQKLGEIGEAVVARQLCDAFPADQFAVVSAQGHQADIHAQVDVSQELPVQALIEVKLYSGDVPSAEVEKFRRDLLSTGTRFGLMTSLTSRIMGVHGPLQVEETEDYTAVYVSNAGIDGLGTLQGMATLKAIMLYRARAAAAVRISAAAIEQAWRRVSQELDELNSIAQSVRGFRQAVHAVQRSVFDQLTQLADNANRADVRLQLAAERLSGRICEELNSLPTTRDLVALPAVTAPDAVLVHLDQLDKAKDKRASQFRELFQASTEMGLDVSIDESGHWSFVRDGAVVANTDGTKTRLDLVVVLSGDAPVEVLPSLETINPKKGGLLIKGGDRAKALERFRFHLTPAA